MTARPTILCARICYARRPYKEFTLFNDDTIEHDNLGETKFQVQVANPLYSAKWSADKKFESDPRFSNCGALAPKSYSDLMFLEHIDRIMNAHAQRDEIEKFSHKVTLGEIKENDYNHNIPRYVDTFEEKHLSTFRRFVRSLQTSLRRNQAAIDKVNSGLKLLRLFGIVYNIL